jgi:hypothetical protein
MAADNDRADDQPATVAADSDATTIVPPPEEAPELALSLDNQNGDNAEKWHRERALRAARQETGS